MEVNIILYPSQFGTKTDYKNSYMWMIIYIINYLYY